MKHLSLLLFIGVLACLPQRKSIVVDDTTPDGRLELAENLLILPRLLAIVYQKEHSIRLKKLPAGYRYDIIADPQGIGVSTDTTDTADMIHYKLIPQAVGHTAVVVTIYDNKDKSIAIVDILVSVSFAANYTLAVNEPMTVKTFTKVDFTYDKSMVLVTTTDKCRESFLHECISEYIFTPLKPETTEISFEGDFTTNKFTITGK